MARHHERTHNQSLYLAERGDDWIEYDSMINVRPSQGNRSRGVEDPGLREAVRSIVSDLVRAKWTAPSGRTRPDSSRRMRAESAHGLNASTVFTAPKLSLPPMM